MYRRIFQYIKGLDDTILILTDSVSRHRYFSVLLPESSVLTSAPIAHSGLPDISDISLQLSCKRAAGSDARLSTAKTNSEILMSHSFIKAKISSENFDCFLIAHLKHMS